MNRCFLPWFGVWVFLGLGSLSGQVAVSLPIGLRWKPHFEEGYVLLEIENKGKEALLISPILNMSYPKTPDAHPHLLGGHDEQLTIAVLQFFEPPSNPILGEDLKPIMWEGPLPPPIEVAAGETKIVKLEGIAPLAASAKTATKMVFSLYRNEKSVFEIPAEKIRVLAE